MPQTTKDAPRTISPAGDIVRGASLVVWGIKDGRDAATSIDNYLESKQKLRVA